MVRHVSFEMLEQLLPAICNKDTSADPDGWSEENPLWGHCAVVALVVQDMYGGDLLRSSLEHVPALAHMRSHYRNRLPDGQIVDLTRPQFGSDYPDLIDEPRTREYVLSNPATLHRYELLSRKLRLANLNNPSDR